MKKRVLFLILALIFILNFSSFAQLPTAEVQRAEEITEKEKILREKIEKEKKVFIKRIIVEGVTLLSEDQIKGIILPYQKKWLISKDIQQILEFLKQTYKQMGYNGQPSRISYQIKKKHLIIKVEESMQ